MNYFCGRFGIPVKVENGVRGKEQFIVNLLSHAV